jgi:hypothetical protein
MAIAQVGTLQTKPVAHSEESAHAFRQAVALTHVYPPQSPVFWAHCPPLQVKVISVDTEHVGSPQVVPAG